MSDYVFVYGTLRRRFSNHHLLGRALYVGAGRTREPFALYLDDYPYVIRHEAVSAIVGEVYKVDVATMFALDALEEHPHVYRREKVGVVLEDGQETEAWLYFYPTPRGRLIASGDLTKDPGRSKS
jgi:gamma-glutamylcyclotransferase (GGCT)/AIG2-like uncharacterized protein YtfP